MPNPHTSLSLDLPSFGAAAANGLDASSLRIELIGVPQLPPAPRPPVAACRVLLPPIHRPPALSASTYRATSDCKHHTIPHFSPRPDRLPFVSMIACLMNNSKRDATAPRHRVRPVSLNGGTRRGNEQEKMKMRGLVHRAHDPGSTSSRMSGTTLPIRTTIVPTHATARYCNLRREAGRREWVTPWDISRRNAAQELVVPHIHKIDIVPMRTHSRGLCRVTCSAFSRQLLPIRARIAAVSSTATIHGHLWTSPTRRLASFAATREEVCGKDEFGRLGLLRKYVFPHVLIRLLIAGSLGSASLILHRGWDTGSASSRIDGILQLTHARIIPRHLAYATSTRLGDHPPRTFERISMSAELFRMVSLSQRSIRQS
ncbi:hypothetical protein B0H13DRAFT_2667033 [Mycena leptocephala]|nr:hypothetical protein B0H13DRAFT_2667033 [Mycena leptocephala]